MVVGFSLEASTAAVKADCPQRYSSQAVLVFRKAADGDILWKADANLKPV